MAARIRKIRHDDETRAKIKTSQLVNRLTSHVLGQISMEATQVTAALGLLRKTLPDLSAVEQSGEIAVHDVSEKLPTPAEWEAEHTKPADARTH